MAQNELACLPAELGKLKTLDNLDLSSNKITAIPPELKSLAKLGKLNLQKNALAALPEFLVEFDCIKKQPALLSSLFLDNSITELP